MLGRESLVPFAPRSTDKSPSLLRCSFVFGLYVGNIAWTTGGDYKAFAELIQKTLTCWNRVGIVPYFVFDGEYSADLIQVFRLMKTKLRRTTAQI